MLISEISLLYFRFNRNEFLEDAARLGVRPGTLLTRREWRAVRRRIPNKPSRFSRRFIASQLNKRNLYRNTVRMLQRHPEMSTRIKFPYDVVAPIPVGSTVTAYSSTYRILHRGTVLSYDATGARYLIQFERKEFGHEFVPDTEVATHGEPAILIRAPSRTISEVYNGIFGYYRSVSSLTSSCGSSYGPIEGTRGFAFLRGSPVDLFCELTSFCRLLQEQSRTVPVFGKCLMNWRKSLISNRWIFLTKQAAQFHRQKRGTMLHDSRSSGFWKKQLNMKFLLIFYAS